ncbi:calcium-dependent protein kinase cdpk4, partial [Cystoisospora suis]
MGCTQSKGRPPASSPARVGASDRAAAVTASGNAQDAAHAARLHGDLDKPAKLGIGSGKVASGGKDSKLKFLGSSRGRQHSFAPQSLTESPDGPASWRRTTAPSARGSSGRQSLLLRGRVQESNGGAGSTGTSSPRGGTVGVQSGVQTRHGLQDVSSSSSSTSTRRPPPAGTLHCPGLSSSAPVLFESDCGDGPRPLLNGPKWIGSIAPARTLRRRLFSRDGRAGFARVSSVFRRRPKPGALETREGNASSSRQGIWSRRPVSSSASVDVPGSAEPHHCPRCGRTLRSSDRLSQQTHLPRQKIIGAAGPSQGATESARDPSSQDRTVFRISGRARTEGSMDVVCQRCGWPASSRPRDEGGGATGRGALGKEIPDEEGLRPLGRDCSGSTIGSELSVPAEYVVGDPLAFFNSLSHTPLFTSRIRTKLKLEQVYDVSSQILGTGISGAVRTARHRQSGRLVAVKTLNLSGIPPRRI